MPWEGTTVWTLPMPVYTTQQADHQPGSCHHSCVHSSSRYESSGLCTLWRHIPGTSLNSCFIVKLISLYEQKMWTPRVRNKQCSRPVILCWAKASEFLCWTTNFSANFTLAIAIYFFFFLIQTLIFTAYHLYLCTTIVAKRCKKPCGTA